MARCKYFCKQVAFKDKPSADWHFEYAYENLHNPSQWEVALQTVWISSKENKEDIEAIGLPLTLHCSNSWYCHRTATGAIERKHHILGQICIQDLPKGGSNKKGERLFAKSDFQESPLLTWYSFDTTANPVKLWLQYPEQILLPKIRCMSLSALFSRIDILIFLHFRRLDDTAR